MNSVFQKARGTGFTTGEMASPLLYCCWAVTRPARAAISNAPDSIGGNTMSDHSRSAPFSVADYLNTPDRAAVYLNAAMEDGDERVLVNALRNVARASIGMTSLGKKSGLASETVYRMLDEDGNPRLSSLIYILNALELALVIKPRNRAV